MLLGIPDPSVVAALTLCVLSSILCVVWGILKWNEDDKNAASDEIVRHWVAEEEVVEKEL